MKENIKESLQFILQHNAIGSPLVQHAQNLARYITLEHYSEANPNATEIANSLLHVCMELSGTISEYRSMPCKSLEERMFATESRYRKRITDARDSLSNLQASPQVTDGQIKPRAREEFLKLAESCGARITGKPDGSEPIEVVFPIPAWRKFDALLSAPPAAEMPEVPYNLRSQFEKFMVLWSEHLYGAPVDIDKKQDEGLGETYKSQFMAGAWFIWQSVAAGNAQLPEGSLPMLPAASQFVHGYSESQVVDFAGKVLAIAAAPQEAKPVAADDLAAFETWKAYPLPAMNADGQFDKDWLHREWKAFCAGRQQAPAVDRDAVIEEVAKHVWQYKAAEVIPSHLMQEISGICKWIRALQSQPQQVTK